MVVAVALTLLSSRLLRSWLTGFSDVLLNELLVVFPLAFDLVSDLVALQVGSEIINELDLPVSDVVKLLLRKRLVGLDLPLSDCLLASHTWLVVDLGLSVHNSLNEWARAVSQWLHSENLLKLSAFWQSLQLWNGGFGVLKPLLPLALGVFLTL